MRGVARVGLARVAIFDMIFELLRSKFSRNSDLNLNLPLPRTKGWLFSLQTRHPALVPPSLLTSSGFSRTSVLSRILLHVCRTNAAPPIHSRPLGEGILDTGAGMGQHGVISGQAPIPIPKGCKVWHGPIDKPREIVGI